MFIKISKANMFFVPNCINAIEERREEIQKNANYVDCIESKAIAIGNHVFTIPKAHRHLITEYFLLFQRKKG